MPFRWSKDKDLNATHPHSERHQLHRKCFSGAAGANDGNIGIFIDSGIEEVYNAQRVIMPIDSQKDTRVIGHLKGSKHISGSCARSQNISLGFSLQLRVKEQKRHGRPQRCFLLEIAVMGMHVHGFQQIYHLLFTPHKFLIGLSRNRYNDRHIIKVFILIGNRIFDVIPGLNAIGQLLIICTCVLHRPQFCFIQPNALRHTIQCLSSNLPAEV